jgi:hypothetical protein
MANSSLSCVNLSSLNADKSFWDQIFEVRRYVDSHCSEIWTQERIELCGQLDSTSMEAVLGDMRQKGSDIISELATEPVKLLMDIEDESGLAKILMSLKYPNEVFNTVGNYESYMNCNTTYLSSSYDEFAESVQEAGDTKFKELNSTIVTAIAAICPGTSAVNE